MKQKIFLRLTDEKINEIVVALKENDGKSICDLCSEPVCENCDIKNKLAKHVLIENYIGLAYSLAKRFATKKNYDDLRSVALLSLVEAVSRIDNLEKVRNFSAYVTSCIVHKLKEFILTDGVIVLKSNRVAGNEHLRNVIHAKEFTVHVSKTPPLEIQELLDLTVKTESEKIILNCIIEGGYSVKDMAEKCSISSGRVSQIKGNLMERLMGVFNDV